MVRQVGAVQELPRTAGIYQAELSLRLHGNFSSSLSLYWCLENVAPLLLVRRGFSNIVILHHQHLPVSDTTTDVFVFTVFYLCSFSLARHLPSWCREGIWRKTPHQPAVATLSLHSAGLPYKMAAGFFKFEMYHSLLPCLGGRTGQVLQKPVTQKQQNTVIFCPSTHSLAGGVL